MKNLLLRALDPEKDLDLFREAYDWRTSRRYETEASGTIPFEEFASYKPTEVSMGLFNGELIAVYLIQQRGPHLFQVHFASRRKTARDDALSGALTLRDWLLRDGDAEIFGWILEAWTGANHPIHRFAIACGFHPTGDIFQDSDTKVTWHRYSTWPSDK